jgi:hypothetical protein
MGYSAQNLFPIYLGALGRWLPPPGSQRVVEIETKFQRLHHVFGVQQLNGSSLSDQTESRKSNHQAAILDFRLPVWSHNIETTCIELLDPENTGVAVEILFLTHLQAEILECGNHLSLVTYVAKKA